MNICFVLPRMSQKAIGGYKIVYEYANRLAYRGYNVSILYLNTNYLKAYRIPRFIKKTYFNILSKREPSWFELDKRIEIISDYSNGRTNKVLHNSDVAVATAVRTAPFVAENFKTMNRIYLIQGRENWYWDDEYVDSTYRLGMKHVVISNWLKEIVDPIAGYDSVLIRNPIDLEKYRVITPIAKRPQYSISVLYNPNPVKGFNNAFEVIKRLKDKYPKLLIKCFGAYPRPDYFPDWIDYTENATQQQVIKIYNQTQAYLCSSINEGYGLTGLEAMACGCALSSTNYKAVYEYAVDGENCLLSSVGDIDRQVSNMCKLFDDYDFREKIIKSALISVKQFSWDLAIRDFMELLQKEY